MPEEELTIFLPLDSDIINPVTGIQRLDEQTVSHQGRWRIHKSDPDNIFPSILMPTDSDILHFWLL